ncbi:hypothetical protein ABK040_011841 [Willaertia magna]
MKKYLYGAISFANQRNFLLLKLNQKHNKIKLDIYNNKNNNNNNINHHSIQSNKLNFKHFTTNLLNYNNNDNNINNYNDNNDYNNNYNNKCRKLSSTELAYLKTSLYGKGIYFQLREIYFTTTNSFQFSKFQQALRNVQLKNALLCSKIILKEELNQSNVSNKEELTLDELMERNDFYFQLLEKDIPTIPFSDCSSTFYFVNNLQQDKNLKENLKENLNENLKNRKLEENVKEFIKSELITKDFKLNDPLMTIYYFNENFNENNENLNKNKENITKNRHCLLIRYHHSIGDGLSMHYFIKSLFKEYEYLLQFTNLETLNKENTNLNKNLENKNLNENTILQNLPKSDDELLQKSMLNKFLPKLLSLTYLFPFIFSLNKKVDQSLFKNTQNIVLERKPIYYLIDFNTKRLMKFCKENGITFNGLFISLLLHAYLKVSLKISLQNNLQNNNLNVEKTLRYIYTAGFSKAKELKDIFVEPTTLQCQIATVFNNATISLQNLNNLNDWKESIITIAKQNKEEHYKHFQNQLIITNLLTSAKLKISNFLKTIKNNYLFMGNIPTNIIISNTGTINYLKFCNDELKIEKMYPLTLNNLFGGSIVFSFVTLPEEEDTVISSSTVINKNDKNVKSDVKNDVNVVKSDEEEKEEEKRTCGCISCLEPIISKEVLNEIVIELNNFIDDELC